MPSRHCALTANSPTLVASADFHARQGREQMGHIPLAPAFGALVDGVDLARMDVAQFRRLYELWQGKHLLVLRGHGLDGNAFEDFAFRFGEIDAAADVGCGETSWGADLPWLERPPYAGLLRAREAPAAGGASWFACLPAALQSVAPDLVARLRWLAIQHGPHLHPMVIMQPETGQHSLFLGTRRESRIVGVPIAESERLLNIVWSYGTADPVILCHRWRAGDIVLWNNLTVMHRHDAVTPPDSRKLQHIRVQGRYTLAAPIVTEAV
jgi:taurine dioxygenase